MAMKKKRKSSSKPKRTAIKKKSAKQAHPKKAKKAKKRAAARTKSAKPARNKKLRASGSISSSGRRPIRGEGFIREEESGDLQGLSRRETADSESVDELLEEGNAFEAGVISGVEEADDSDEKGVRTHEVPSDDVPREYLDEE